jgi:cell division protein FtsX
VEAWTDERLNDLAASHQSLHADVADIKQELARHGEALNHLIASNREIRADLAALHRLIAQVGWGLSAALVGVLIALIVAAV